LSSFCLFLESLSSSVDVRGGLQVLPCGCFHDESKERVLFSSFTFSWSSWPSFWIFLVLHTSLLAYDKRAGSWRLRIVAPVEAPCIFLENHLNFTRASS
jgi:hypothetical protein